MSGDLPPGNSSLISSLTPREQRAGIAGHGSCSRLSRPGSYLSGKRECLGRYV